MWLLNGDMDGSRIKEYDANVVRQDEEAIPIYADEEQIKNWSEKRMSVEEA